MYYILFCDNQQKISMKHQIRNKIDILKKHLVHEMVSGISNLNIHDNVCINHAHIPQTITIIFYLCYGDKNHVYFLMINEIQLYKINLGAWIV